MNNNVECLTKEEEKEVQACIEESDGVEEKSIGHVVFKELKNNRPIASPNRLNIRMHKPKLSM